MGNPYPECHHQYSSQRSLPDPDDPGLPAHQSDRGNDRGHHSDHRAACDCRFSLYRQTCGNEPAGSQSELHRNGAEPWRGNHADHCEGDDPGKRAAADLQRDHGHHHHASLRDIEEIIGSLPVSGRVKADAKAVYALIAEAESIAVGIDRKRGGRPLTHDLFLRFAKEFGIEIKEVVINRFREGVYYAMLVCKQGDNLTMVDARPSDAIAIAVRCGCGISAYETVMAEAGIIMETIEQDDQPDNQDDPVNINKVSPDTNFDLLTVHELEDMLEEAIENEDYGLAAKIRDEIKGRGRS